LPAPAISGSSFSTEEALSAFQVLHLTLRLTPRQTLKLPAENKGNTLRGAFGVAFRRLVCIPECPDARRCPLGGTCPYRAIFEPTPPTGAKRLSKNQDAPRPFVFRPPLHFETRNSKFETRVFVAAGVAPPLRPAPDLPPASSPASASLEATATPDASSIQKPKSEIQNPKTSYEAGEAFEFGLILLGKAVEYLPYCVLAFRDLAHGGFGLNRAPCELDEVLSTSPKFGIRGAELERQSSTRDSESRGSQTGRESDRSPSRLESGRLGGETGGTPDSQLVYSASDQLFRASKAFTLADWVAYRLRELGLGPLTADQGQGTKNQGPITITVYFLTPTFLRFEEQAVRQPEFHHLFKRVRDRLNALSTFYGPGPIDADFKGLGQRAEQVRTVVTQGNWVERSRRSSKTRQRHELSGFVGECTFEFPRLEPLESEISNAELLRWLLAGELLHVGRHTAWGNGWYVVV